MKKLMIAMLTLAVSQVWAQGFEGTIKWSMKMEITDPAMKAKMEEGQQKMNDPANQAKMKELQDKMNDPKFKAMMESNPAMKAQMENMMKAQQGGGGDMMSNMMPKGFTVKMKDGNVLTIMEGGMMAGEMLRQKDKDQTVRLDRDKKTYMVMPSGGGGQGAASGPQPTVTKTSETMKILNYNCTKYVITMSERGQTITSNMWTTTDIKDIDVKAMAKQRVGRGQSLFYEGMEGVPLRIESSTPQGSTVMEVTEIKKESLNASDFTIPSDFTETKGMFGRN